MTDKLGAFKITEGHIRKQSDIDYANNMAKALLDGPRPPKPVIPTHFNGKLVADLSYSEKEEFYISMQPPSTQAALRRDPKDDEKHWNREIKDWKANPTADLTTEAGRDAAVALRPLNPQEIDIAKANKIGRNTLGDSKNPSADKEKKERSVWAYIFSRPATLTEEEKTRVTKLEPIVSAPLEPEEPKKQGFFSRIFGGKNTSTSMKQDKMKYHVKGSSIVFTKETDAE